MKKNPTLRSNSSGKTILKYFCEKSEENGRKYYVTVPWDERNLAEMKAYYTVELLGEMIDYYFKRYLGPWSIKDFQYKASDLAAQLEADKVSQEYYKSLVKKTEERMREAGYN